MAWFPIALSGPSNQLTHDIVVVAAAAAAVFVVVTFSSPKTHPDIDSIAPNCFASFTNGTCPGDEPGQCT